MRVVDKLSSKKLKGLYWQKKMSSVEIAKAYHCSPEYIRELMRKHQVKTRTKSVALRLLYNISISKKDLEEFYLEKKMSSVEIAKKFKCSPFLVRARLKQYNIPIRSHYEAHLLCNQPRYERHDFSGTLEEKAYLIGFRKGDLYVVQAHPRTIISSMASTKPAQIKVFENLFSKYGHIWRGKRIWKSKFGTRYKETAVQCYLNNTFEFLLDKKDLIERWALENTNYFAAFLAGYADAEGSFCIYNKTDGAFSIRSQDKIILHQIRSKLIDLGILCRPPQIARGKGTKDIRGTISNKDIWGLWVHRKDALLKLIDLIGPYSKHTDKQRGMKMVKNNVFERDKKYNRHQASKYDKLYIGEGIKICRDTVILKV